MPYEAFLVQYSGEIKKRICKDKGWTITKATNYLASKFTYDEYIYSIMCDIVNDGVMIILNRNPTITYGSILMMKVRKVKQDPNDLSLSIPSAILPGLNADFDGDVLNDLALTMEEFWEMFDQFSPTNMLIDRTSSTIRLDLSAMENISTAILSDM